MLMSESLALAASVCIALSGMLIAELKGRVDIVRLARWQMVAAFAITGTAALVVGGWRSIGSHEVGLLVISGICGIFIASTTYFAAIYIIGPRNTALLFALASPFSLVLGYFFLGETIVLQQMVGIVLVLAGIVLAVGVRRRDPVPAVEVPAVGAGPAAIGNAAPQWLGMLLGIVTALGQALGSLFARPAMEAGVDPFAAMAVRSGVSALLFVLIALLPLAIVRRPYNFRGVDLGLAVASAFVGTGLGMSLLLAALATGNVGIVTTLSSMTPIMILPMVWLRSGVAPRREAWLGAALAVAGTAAISLAG
jgi:drug/metabolite transporter (DMT)-like permease